MATLNKILGRRKPVQTTTEILYTVPSSTQANINLFCSNQSAGDDTVQVAICKVGDSPSAPPAAAYVLYNTIVRGNATINLTGLALGAGEFITVRSQSGYVSFNATGIEIS